MEAVLEAAAGGDALARSLVERSARGLGTAIHNLARLFDPEVVILGGPMARAGSALYPPLLADLAWRLRATGCLPVVPQHIAEHAGIVGAAALACR